MKRKGLNKEKVSHKIRPIRLSDENWEWLNSKKRGTWNYTLTRIRKENENSK